jgi:aminoglycoside N3'-acetyltransferase
VTVGPQGLRRALREAGLENRPVCLHSSLSSHGHMEGGAATVVDAFLDAGATLLVPTFGGSRYAVTAPPDLRPPRNGISYDGWTDQGGLPVDPAAAGFAGREFTTADNDTLMGAIPAEVLTRPGRQRGNHPLNSFTAIGPGASELIRGQTPADVYAPLAALAGQGGLVALAGVGLTSMTLLHYAEQVAGRVMLRRWALAGGKVVMVAVGGCSDGFERFAGALAPVETTVAVGRSHWRVFPAAAVVAIAAAIIRQDPGSTRCARTDCEQCADKALGGPLLDG